MAAETMAFADTYDAAYSLKNDLGSILGKNIPLLILTDSKPLFDVVIWTKYTTEKRLMIDLSAAREGFARRDVTNIFLIRSEDNIAEPMTKLASNHALHHLISTNAVSHKILEYVVDPATQSANKAAVDGDQYKKKL
jgi:hypothetical protein